MHHTVQSGETLSAIGAAYGVSSSAIAKANPWIENPDLIRVGWILHIPEASTPPPPDPDLVIPETLDYPNNVAIDDGEGFLFIAACLDTPEINCGNPNKPNAGIADFAYVGHGMPYLYSEAQPGNHDHAWWVPGDRERYEAAYCFLYDKHPNPFGGSVTHPDAKLISRATLVRPIGQSYGQVNDKFMPEGVVGLNRLYDGTPVTASDLGGGTGNEIVTENARAIALDDFDYDAYEPQGPQDIRVGLFRGDGEIADIRDFRKDYGLNSHVEFIGREGNRVTIAVIMGINNKVSHVFYYDTLNDGQMAVEVDGQIVA